MKFSVVIPAYNEARRIGPSLERVWNYLCANYGRGGFEIIVVDDGSRALAESQILARQAPLRESLGRLFNHLIRAFLRIPFRDTQCGFKLFRREAAVRDVPL